MLGQERESKRRGRQSAADLNLNKSGRNYIWVEHKREFWYPCKFSLIEVKKLQQKKYILDILYNYFHICSKKGLVLTKSIQSIQSILFNLNFDWGQTGGDNIKRPMPDNIKRLWWRQKKNCCSCDFRHNTQFCGSYELDSKRHPYIWCLSV